jgi:hypothetical protein
MLRHARIPTMTADPSPGRPATDREELEELYQQEAKRGFR